MSSSSRFALASGDIVSYAEYGDPQGKPVLFFHGFIGSCHQASVAHASAFRYGVRLIAPSRPGVGESSCQKRSTILDSCTQLKELIDYLKLDEFSILGVSGGASYALGCAYTNPERVGSVSIVSGLGPTNEPALRKGMRYKERFFFWLVERYSWAARMFIQRMIREYYNQPNQFMGNFIKGMPQVDQPLFTRKEIYSALLDDHGFVLLSQDAVNSVLQEIRLFAKWGFDIQNISTPKVSLWHGEDDTFVPLLSTQILAKKIPHAKVHIKPGGHFMVVDAIDEIFTDLFV